MGEKDTPLGIPPTPPLSRLRVPLSAHIPWTCGGSLSQPFSPGRLLPHLELHAWTYTGSHWNPAQPFLLSYEGSSDSSPWMSQRSSGRTSGVEPGPIQHSPHPPFCSAFTVYPLLPWPETLLLLPHWDQISDSPTSAALKSPPSSPATCRQFLTRLLFPLAPRKCSAKWDMFDWWSPQHNAPWVFILSLFNS